jgi:hypothetical protein
VIVADNQDIRVWTASATAPGEQILAKERENLHSEGETNQQAKALGITLSGKEMLR